MVRLRARNWAAVEKAIRHGLLMAMLVMVAGVAITALVAGNTDGSSNTDDATIIDDAGSRGDAVIIVHRSALPGNEGRVSSYGVSRPATALSIAPTDAIAPGTPITA